MLGGRLIAGEELLAGAPRGAIRSRSGVVGRATRHCRGQHMAAAVRETGATNFTARLVVGERRRISIDKNHRRGRCCIADNAGALRRRSVRGSLAHCRNGSARGSNSFGGGPSPGTLDESGLDPRELQRVKTGARARSSSVACRRKALGGSSRATRSTAGAGGGGRRRDRASVGELPAKLRDGRGSERQVGPRMFARHQAVPDGGGASHQRVARIFKTFSGFGRELTAGAAPNSRIRKPQSVSAAELAAVGGAGAGTLGPGGGGRTTTALRRNGVPGGGGDAADRTAPALGVIAKAVPAMLEGAEGSDGRGGQTRWRSRLVKFATLASGFCGRADVRVASGRIADNDASAPNPLGNCDYVIRVTDVALLSGQGSGVTLSHGLSVVVDNIVTVLVEL